MSKFLAVLLMTVSALVVAPSAHAGEGGALAAGLLAGVSGTRYNQCSSSIFRGRGLAARAALQPFAWRAIPASLGDESSGKVPAGLEPADTGGVM